MMLANHHGLASFPQPLNKNQVSLEESTTIGRGAGGMSISSRSCYSSDCFVKTANSVELTSLVLPYASHVVQLAASAESSVHNFT